MIRNIAVCVLAVLALGKCVLSSSSQNKDTKSASAVFKTSFAVPSSGDISTSQKVASTGAPSTGIAATASSTVQSSFSTSMAAGSTVQSSFSTSMAASSTVQSSFSTSMAASSAVQSSFVTISASPSATPVLSSTVMSSSQVLHSSSILPVTTSAASFITPSHTAVVVTETVHINDNGTLCLTVVLEADFVIHYNTKNGSKEKTSIPLNGNSTKEVNGTCSYTNNTAYVQFKWNEEGEKPTHTFKMDFERVNGTWSVPQVKAIFQTDDPRFQNATVNEITATVKGSYFGSRKSNKSYICNAQTSFVMSKNVTAMLKNVVLQPFSSNEKPTGTHCAADSPKDDDDDDDNTVPIAVGGALGGLVLIVLVAYIVGRRRSNRGYEQV